MGSPAFKAGGTGDPRPAGSIPVHLRYFSLVPPFGDSRPATAAVVRWPPDGTGFPSTSAISVHFGGLREEIAVVYFGVMKKFFLFVLVAVLVAWVAKKVREV